MNSQLSCVLSKGKNSISIFFFLTPGFATIWKTTEIKTIKNRKTWFSTPAATPSKGPRHSAGLNAGGWHGLGTLQTGRWPRQGQWTAPGDDGAALAAVQATETCSASGQGVICQCGHPSPREGW